MTLLELNDLLKEIISEKVSKSEAFTAFDITMISKRMGNDTYRHRDCKNTIHQIMWDDYPDYQRQLINVEGAPTQPFLYFPPGYNIDDYMPMDRDELFIPVTKNASNVVAKDAYDSCGDWLDDDDDDEIRGPLWF